MVVLHLLSSENECGDTILMKLCLHAGNGVQQMSKEKTKVIEPRPTEEAKEWMNQEAGDGVGGYPNHPFTLEYRRSPGGLRSMEERDPGVTTRDNDNWRSFQVDNQPSIWGELLQMILITE